MTPEELHHLLDAVRSGSASIQQAAERIESMRGYVDGEVARIDTDRTRRRGFPEVIYCQSKRPEEIVTIAEILLEREGLAFGTRCSPEGAEYALSRIPGGAYDAVSRTIRFGPPRQEWTAVTTAVIAAGTSDRPVAEEACMTLETFGAPFDRIYDVGVAGIHRLLHQGERIGRAGVLIVAAGMEGALPSVIGGLFPQPLIAVPTSVGYGTALGGFTPLFGMLTSCASGITVVNIDNGFGAAMAALSILRAIERER
jgi:NCAIR mutase (PurE)-related protein